MPQDKFIIQDSMWLITEPVGVPIYDFDFRRFFDCKTPYELPSNLPGVARIGAFEDYPSLFADSAEIGIDLVHSPDDHLRCTSLLSGIL